MVSMATVHPVAHLLVFLSGLCSLHRLKGRLACVAVELGGHLTAGLLSATLAGANSLVVLCHASHMIVVWRFFPGATYLFESDGR